jgi:hypothetical protein
MLHNHRQEENVNYKSGKEEQAAAKPCNVTSTDDTDLYH